MAHACKKCGGFVGDVGVAYGYAGKWCYCGGGDGKVKRFQDLSLEEMEQMVKTAKFIKQQKTRHEILDNPETSEIYPDKKIIEEVAKIIYHNDGGMTDEDYLNCSGKERRGWQRPEGIMYPTIHEDFIEQHEQDEYRWIAKQVLEYLKTNKKIVFLDK